MLHVRRRRRRDGGRYRRRIAAGWPTSSGRMRTGRGGDIRCTPVGTRRTSSCGRWALAALHTTRRTTAPCSTPGPSASYLHQTSHQLTKNHYVETTCAHPTVGYAAICQSVRPSVCPVFWFSSVRWMATYARLRFKCSHPPGDRLPLLFPGLQWLFQPKSVTAHSLAGTLL